VVKRKLLAVLSILLLLLTGCEAMVGVDTQNLMQPPQATGDKAAIQQILGKDVTLKYPQSQRSEYRSAVVMYDLTGDGDKEAMAFYSKNSEVAATSYFTVMDKIDGEWTDVGTFSYSATDVDRIAFGDLDGDGIKEMIVGWCTFNSNINRMAVYRYNVQGERPTVTQWELSADYSELVVMDFDGDGRDDLLLTLLNMPKSATLEKEIPACATLFRYREELGVLHEESVVELDPSVVRYAAVTSGKVSASRNGVVLDEYRAGDEMVTELIYWDPDRRRLVAPIYNPAVQERNYTQRPATASISKDINSDGIIEVPVVKLMPGNDAGEAETACYRTEWLQYSEDNDAVQTAVNMITSYTDGYLFSLPDSWVENDAVTAKMDTKTKTMTFSAWYHENRVAGPALLKLQVFTEKEWEEGQGTEGFIQLEAQSGKVYAAIIPTPDDPLAITISEVRKNFSLVTTG
jgi:hypothetical protein